ncbi:pitrilysin family protein [Ekhidna sp.]|uniref:M16 family metallopeptidase n=1 Tax=Ekhidna sp. TaxID=2608089 RepID=UPI0032993D20
MRCIAMCFCAFVVVATSYAQKRAIEIDEFSIEYQKFKLTNGLTVIFNIDRSDPVVAVVLTCHVGSSRELEGTTGLAHLFEHLLFINSENLGKGGLDELSERVGGSGANGSTNRDKTNFHQTVPKNALEKMIWAEAEKLGFFINTITESAIDIEKEIVKNEKRQRFDNRPYGLTNYVISKNLYAKNHPYNWPVIGSLKDIQNVNLSDARAFYERWYVPNNTVLTIVGDFDPSQAKKWIEKYFNEIEAGVQIPKAEKRPVSLNQTKKLYYEDNFASVPQLSLTWPGVYKYHNDMYTLQALVDYLAESRNSPLYQMLILDDQLTDHIIMGQRNGELAGSLLLRITAFKDISLEDIHKKLNSAFSKFEREGISPVDLNRIKIQSEASLSNNLTSVLRKGLQLSEYEIFTGDSGFMTEHIENIRSVSQDDVIRVYRKYLKDKDYVATSFVPKGKKHLSLKDSKLAQIFDEESTNVESAKILPQTNTALQRTPSFFDRSVEPPYGESLRVKVPEIWTDQLASGIKLYGIENNEIPIVKFQIQLKGGMLLENLNKTGVSNLLASLLMKGTATRTSDDLEDAILDLGASIQVNARKESIIVSVTTLAKYYSETVELVQEILQEPRWDVDEFELLKKGVIGRIERRLVEPAQLADDLFAKLLYGEDHILSKTILGTKKSVTTISINDLKEYYDNFVSTTIMSVHLIGAISKEEAMDPFVRLDNHWNSKEFEFPIIQNPKEVDSSIIYFYNVPGAKQAEIRFGYPALAATSKDYYAISTVLNYRLGGGNSQLMQRLRRDKGYTYSIKSRFVGSQVKGPFYVRASIRTNVIYESAKEILEILENYGVTYSEEDLHTTKDFLIKNSALSYESYESKINLLFNIDNYGLPENYPSQQMEMVKEMKVDDIKRLAKRYIHPDKMIWLIVGDVSKQLEKFEELGLGKPILINK